MPEDAEVLVRPEFGQLCWSSQYQQWVTRYELPSGRRIHVVVQTRAEHSYSFIETASARLVWAVANERCILRDALEHEVLALYNDTWRMEDEPELTLDQFAACLTWDVLEIKDIDIVPIAFSYTVDDLFGGHDLTVEVDSELRYRQIDLIG